MGYDRWERLLLFSPKHIESIFFLALLNYEFAPLRAIKYMKFRFKIYFKKLHKYLHAHTSKIRDTTLLL